MLKAKLAEVDMYLHLYFKLILIFFLSLTGVGTSCGGVSPTRKDQPLFTLRQVGMICERLLKEREEKVREEYEETMTSKLAGLRGLDTCDLTSQSTRHMIPFSLKVFYIYMNLFMLIVFLASCKSQFSQIFYLLTQMTRSSCMLYDIFLNLLKVFLVKVNMTIQCVYS